MNCAAENVQPRIAVIALEGEFDLAQRDQLAAAFGLASLNDVIVVDLAATSYIDSTVLSQLINFRNELAKRSGRLVLAHANGSVQRLLDVTQAGTMFSAGPQLDEVIRDTEPIQRIVLVGNMFGAAN